MSILPLSSLFGISINYLSVSINVTDTTYTPTQGMDIQSIDESRIITGAVDTSGSQRLENLFGGNVSDGDISITTTDTLYIGDIVNYAANELQRQSYITWEGLTYRVADCSPWLKHGDFKVYLAKRHVRQDLV